MTMLFKKVLVGVDGRENGQDAIALGSDLLDPGARLTITHVHRDDPTAQGDSHAILELEQQRADVTADLVSVAAANTATGLHRQAADIGAEVLVVGSSNRGALGRLMLGDDIRETINGAPCHVVVAARGYAAREAGSPGSRTSAETSSEARLGDWIESRGIHGELAHHDGSVRRGQIVEILGPPEYVHYRVQWDERHDSIVYPDDGVLILSGSHNP